MAKYGKKGGETVSVSFSDYGSGRKSNQDSKGVIDLPNYDTDPANESYKGKKLCFPAMVAKGESPNDGDVNLIAPTGVVSSKGQGFNQGKNYWSGADGHWNKNDGWPGANRTGE